MSLVLLIVILLLLGCVGSLPTWGWSAGWGYGPSSVLGAILLVVVILALLDRI